MKVEHTNQQPEFQPIELKIIIESEQELAGLYRRMVVLHNVVEQEVSESRSFNGIVSSKSKELFKILYDIATERGYVK